MGPTTEPSAALKAPSKGNHPRSIVTVLKGEAEPHVNRGLDIIASVHDLGERIVMSPLPVKSTKKSKSTTYGVYYTEAGTHKALCIKMMARSPDATTFNFIHEYGHFLDHQVMHLPGQWGSIGDATPEQIALRKALHDSKGRSTIKYGLTGAKKFREYLLNPKEMFARAYAQWIATRSADPGLLHKLANCQPGGKAKIASQWDDEDFKPIAAAMEALFRAKGMLQ